MRPITSQDLVDIREHFPLDSCLLPPDLTVTPEAARAFDRLYDAACAQGPAAQIAYDLPYPKYLFLEYLSVTRGLLFHGSNNRAIDVLRPIRFSTDSSEFGSQDAVYASQDPLWAMYFALLDFWSDTGGEVFNVKIAKVLFCCLQLQKCRLSN